MIQSSSRSSLARSLFFLEPQPNIFCYTNALMILTVSVNRCQPSQERDSETVSTSR
jgi:hypothetical protein